MEKIGIKNSGNATDEGYQSLLEKIKEISEISLPRQIFNVDFVPHGVIPRYERKKGSQNLYILKLDITGDVSPIQWENDSEEFLLPTVSCPNINYWEQSISYLAQYENYMFINFVLKASTQEYGELSTCRTLADLTSNIQTFLKGSRHLEVYVDSRFRYHQEIQNWVSSGFVLWNEITYVDNLGGVIIANHEDDENQIAVMVSQQDPNSGQSIGYALSGRSIAYIKIDKFYI